MASWSTTWDALRRGDLDARDRVARLVIGTLQAAGAYDHRDSWDDLVQDVLLTLLTDEPDSEDARAFAAWVRRTTHNRYVDQLRKEQGRRRAGNPVTAGWRTNVALEDATLIDESALEEGLEHDLARALSALDARKRGVLECKYTLGCTDAEGAERLGESLGTYKRLVGQALAELRAVLVDRDETA